MKRRPLMYILVAILLLFATVFSVWLAPGHKEDCEHATVCEYCEEIEFTKNAINMALEEHGDCKEDNCNTCVFLVAQKERIEKKAAEHTCHAVVCNVCARMALGERLRFAICLFAVLALVCVAWRVISLISKEKTLFIEAFTLSSLKVRLNN